VSMMLWCFCCFLVDTSSKMGLGVVRLMALKWSIEGVLWCFGHLLEDVVPLSSQDLSCFCLRG